MKIGKIEIVFSTHCAWRAVYMYLNKDKIAHIGVDPNTSNGGMPQAFGSFMGKEFRFSLPSVKYKYPCSNTYSCMYKLSTNFWHNVDGRYGWGTKKV